MIRKSRLAFFIVAASLPMIAACSESATGPAEFEVRTDMTVEEMQAMGCGDTVPWGFAPCIRPA